MKTNDFVLIQRTLDGDQNAFTELVNKYQKRVHSLVWRKIGDFHIAEEITQDIFLKVYKKLSTLKPPQHFPGWLYVIASRHCIAWQRKKQQPTESLDAMPAAELEELCYTRYEVEREKTVSIRYQREIVKRLLQKLPESERTVVTMHYLAEMSCEEISQFLGVSQNTIKSRLHRARKRLEKQEHLLHDASGAFQLSPTLTENIMREIARIKPASTSVSKPWMPWGLSFASVLLVMLMVGMGPRTLSRFQKPYSLAAASEVKIELVDTPIVRELERKSDALTQIGKTDALGKNRETGFQAESLLFAAAQAEETDLPAAKSEWIQTKGPAGIGDSGVKLFLTSDQTLYAITRTEFYKLTEKADMWTLVSSSSPDQIFDGVMAERDNTLYLLTSNEILASIDDGKTWDNLGRRPDGSAVALVATDTAMYLVLRTDVFRLRFEDVGHAWELIGDSLRAILQEDNVPEAVNLKSRPNRDAADNPNFPPSPLPLGRLPFHIYDALAIDNTLFIGTSKGIFRFTDDWEKLPVPTSHGIKSLAAAEDRLYAGTSVVPPAPVVGQGPIPIPMVGQGPMGIGPPRGGIFSSTDLGDTWTDITPKTRIHSIGTVEVVTAGDALILSGHGLRSKDGGKTWTVPKEALRMVNMSPTIALDEDNLYRTSIIGIRGISRSTDGGNSWHPFMTGIVNSHVRNLIKGKNVLFAQTPTEMLKSTDGGESWEYVDLISIDEKALPLPFVRRMQMKVAAANGLLYASNSQPDGVTLFRLSDDGDVFLPVEGIPDFAIDTLQTELEKKSKNESDKAKEQFKTEWEKKREEEIKNNPNVDINKVKKQFLVEWIEKRMKALRNNNEAIRININISPDFDFDHVFLMMQQWMTPAIQDQITEEQRINGTFTVADDTVFMVYRYKLFRWRFGETAWSDTGLELKDHDGILASGEKGFALAASGNTVYAGKRHGELFLSQDNGDTWSDITANLAFPGYFREIKLAGSTVYILTEVGVMSSHDGETWHDLTDDNGNVLLIDYIAIDGETAYGVCDSGIYQADEQTNTWKQIIPEMPHMATSLAVDGNTFYIGTRQNGVYRFQRANQ
ncbi:MAG: sigma-70 family RNA polymerase sigma factor [Candidatus Poribacteria bacterium]|nr:sigma-70 family RNA polymerase sigma factor [Candidatus Poribacteria bacterium]